MSEKDIFSDLVPLKARLKDASVKANQVLKAARERLREIGLGVEGWVTLESERDPALYRSSAVLFGYAHRTLGEDPDFPETQKEKGARWDLWIRWEEEEEPQGYYRTEGPTPVLSCRCELRIAAARSLPKLAAKLKANAEKTIVEIDEAAEEFS